MMIFSSYGFRADITREQLDTAIADKSGTMLIIPLAGMTCKITGEYEKMAAVETGFRGENISIFYDTAPDEHKGKHFDYIYVPGGNTFKLLNDVKKYGLDTLIKENIAEGAVYIGVSAGAYLACPDIRYVRLLEDNNHITDDDFSALNLTDSYFLCHYDYRGMEYYRRCREYLGSDAEIITITNDEIVIL